MKKTVLLVHKLVRQILKSTKIGTTIQIHCVVWVAASLVRRQCVITTKHPVGICYFKRGIFQLRSRKNKSPKRFHLKALISSLNFIN